MERKEQVNKTAKKEEVKRMEGSNVFISIQDFRLRAEEEDYAELERYLVAKGEKGFKAKGQEPDGPYHFSAAAARQAVKVWKAKKAAEVQPQAMADEGLKLDERRRDFDKKSVMMTADNWSRLQELYKRYPSRDKSYVLDAFLDFALTKLGL